MFRCPKRERELGLSHRLRRACPGGNADWSATTKTQTSLPPLGLSRWSDDWRATVTPQTPPPPPGLSRWSDDWPAKRLTQYSLTVSAPTGASPVEARAVWGSPRLADQSALPPGQARRRRDWEGCAVTDQSLLPPGQARRRHSSRECATPKLTLRARFVLHGPEKFSNTVGRNKRLERISILERSRSRAVPAAQAGYTSLGGMAFHAGTARRLRLAQW